VTEQGTRLEPEGSTDEPAGQLPEEGQSHLVVVFQQSVEVVPADREAARRRERPDPGGSQPSLVQERELAEELALSPLERAVAQFDRDGPVLDDEQPGPRLVGLDQSVLLADFELGRALKDSLEGGVAQVREQRDRSEVFDTIARGRFHGALCITPRLLRKVVIGAWFPAHRTGPPINLRLCLLRDRLGLELRTG
jgi:hypothetical protein